MALKRYKPTSPGRRFATFQDNAEVTKKEPEKRLVEGLKKSGGRDKHGRITPRHPGGGGKRRHRRGGFRGRQEGGAARGGVGRANAWTPVTPKYRIPSF